jgi:hypothetical protein
MAVCECNVVVSQTLISDRRASIFGALRPRSSTNWIFSVKIGVGSGIDGTKLDGTN